MARSANQKLKLLWLRRILLERSDEEHPIPLAQLIGELERQGIRAERKSLYDDMEALRAFGMDVQSRKGRWPSSSCWWTRCSPANSSPGASRTS